jgi:hypothetical protein
MLKCILNEHGYLLNKMSALALTYDFDLPILHPLIKDQQKK